MVYDWLKYFGKFVFVMALGIALGEAFVLMPHDFVPIAFIIVFTLLGAWYAYQRAKIDRAYKESLEAAEDRKKQAEQQSKKKYGRRGAY